jgi:23S rRNA pseudouridine1911/1915/1917 synthase
MPTVLSETSDVLILNKPAGLIVHSDGRTVEPSVAEWVAEKYPTLADVGEPWVSPQGESVRVCGVVHRLDRTTSGVLLVAKTPEMFLYLKGEFKARRVEKMYHALVYGNVKGESGRIVAEIARTSTPPKRWYAKSREESHLRAAITDWRVLKRFETGGEPVTYLELSPKTGRTHQLRVHLASIGHPIIGDHLYAEGKPTLFGFTRPALHAYCISLTLDGAREMFTAPLPQDFEDALRENLEN